MQRTIQISVIALALLLGNSWKANQAAPENEAPKQTEKKKAKKMLRHVVMFKFKEDATKEQIKKVEQEFAQLPKRIDSIKAYEWGTNNSPEKHDKGFTHCFLVTFESEAGRDEYLPHPAHNEFVEILLPILDDVHVLDYWAKKDAK